MGIIQNLLQKWNLLRTKLTAESDWVSVYQSSEEYSVHIQKLKLDNHDIPSTVFNQQDSSYKAFGYIYLNVPRVYEKEALEILNSEHE